MDLITASVIADQFFISGAFVLAFICYFITIVLIISTANDRNKDEVWVFSYFKKASFIFFCFFLLIATITTFSSIPEIIVKRNIALVKIRYTDPKSINKIEKGALNVVNKLDKLIDKGIASIGQEEKK